jgi:hypothetical protein
LHLSLVRSFNDWSMPEIFSSFPAGSTWVKFCKTNTLPHFWLSNEQTDLDKLTQEIPDTSQKKDFSIMSYLQEISSSHVMEFFRGQNIPFLSTARDQEAALPLSRIQVPGYSVNIVLLRVSFE